MPFKSERQRRYLHANEPELAKEWEMAYGNKKYRNSRNFPGDTYMEYDEPSETPFVSPDVASTDDRWSARDTGHEMQSMGLGVWDIDGECYTRHKSTTSYDAGSEAGGGI